jgi:hypothetical protein
MTTHRTGTVVILGGTLALSAAGCLSEPPGPEISVQNVTEALGASSGPVSGAAYWVPVDADIGSFPWTATGVEGIACSPEQADWLREYGSPVLTPQDVVVSNESTQHVAISLKINSDSDAGEHPPGFYLQCGEMDTKTSQMDAYREDGAAFWRVWVELGQNGVTIEEPDEFQMTIDPGKSENLRVFLRGVTSFSGSVSVEAQGEDGAVSTVPIPVYSNAGLGGTFVWPSAVASSPLVFPYRRPDGSTEIHCNDPGMGVHGDLCTEAGIRGRIAIAAGDYQVIDDYLARMASQSDCQDVDRDRDSYIDALSPGLTDAVADSDKVLGAALASLEKLRNTCSPEYVTDLLSYDYYVIDELRQLSEPLEVEDSQPAWADCGQIDVSSAGRWDSPTPGSISLCEDGRVILRLEGWEPITLVNNGGAGGNWVGVSDEYEISGDGDLTWLWFVTPELETIMEMTVTERWWP